MGLKDRFWKHCFHQSNTYTVQGLLGKLSWNLLFLDWEGRVKMSSSFVGENHYVLHVLKTWQEVTGNLIKNKLKCTFYSCHPLGKLYFTPLRGSNVKFKLSSFFVLMTMVIEEAVQNDLSQCRMISPMETETAEFDRFSPFPALSKTIQNTFSTQT